MITKILVNKLPSIIILGFISELSNKKTNILINLNLECLPSINKKYHFVVLKELSNFFQYPTRPYIISVLIPEFYIVWP